MPSCTRPSWASPGWPASCSIRPMTSPAPPVRHQAPIGGSQRVPCCGVDVGDLPPGDTITVAARVTCTGGGDADGAAAAE